MRFRCPSTRLLSTLPGENPYNAEEKFLCPNGICMGTLRERAPFDVPMATVDKYRRGEFTFISASESVHHTALKGRDNSIYAYRIPYQDIKHIITPAYVQHLIVLLENLPPLSPNQENKNLSLKRRVKRSRTYQFWVECKRDGQVGLSKEYLQDGIKAEEFVQHCALLWETIGRTYDQVFPKPSRRLRQFTPPDNAAGDFLAKPWAGMTINQGCINEPVQCEPHKDQKDAFFCHACVVALGNFTGGHVILWELEAIVELKSGDALIFPAHLITHSNTPTEGIRHSLVAYTRQETMKHDASIPNYEPERKKEVQKRKRIKKNGS